MITGIAGIDSDNRLISVPADTGISEFFDEYVVVYYNNIASEYFGSLFISANHMEGGTGTYDITLSPTDNATLEQIDEYPYPYELTIIADSADPIEITLTATLHS